MPAQLLGCYPPQVLDLRGGSASGTANKMDVQICSKLCSRQQNALRQSSPSASPITFRYLTLRGNQCQCSPDINESVKVVRKSECRQSASIQNTSAVSLYAITSLELEPTQIPEPTQVPEPVESPALRIPTELPSTIQTSNENRTEGTNMTEFPPGVPIALIISLSALSLVFILAAVLCWRRRKARFMNRSFNAPSPPFGSPTHPLSKLETSLPTITRAPPPVVSTPRKPVTVSSVLLTSQFQKNTAVYPETTPLDKRMSRPLTLLNHPPGPSLTPSDRDTPPSPFHTQEMSETQLIDHGIRADPYHHYHVHRGYEPTMDDELELKVGYRVIVAEVFDDGWAFGQALPHVSNLLTHPVEGVFPIIALIPDLDDPPLITAQILTIPQSQTNGVYVPPQNPQHTGSRPVRLPSGRMSPVLDKFDLDFLAPLPRMSFLSLASTQERRSSLLMTSSSPASPVSYLRDESIVKVSNVNHAEIHQ